MAPSAPNIASMNEDEDVVRIARAMIENYKDDAFVFSERRAECHLRAGDKDRAVFWRGVAESIREIEANWR